MITLSDLDRVCKEIEDDLLAHIASHGFSVEAAARALAEAGIDPNTRCVIVGNGPSPEFVQAVTEAKSRGVILIGVDIQKDFQLPEE